MHSWVASPLLVESIRSSSVETKKLHVTFFRYTGEVSARLQADRGANSEGPGSPYGTSGRRRWGGISEMQRLWVLCRAIGLGRRVLLRRGDEGTAD